MTPTRKKRLAVVTLIVLGVGAATAVALTAMNDAMRYSITPSEIVSGDFPEGRKLRLGGLVATDSVERDPESLVVHFRVTDCRNDIPVTFTGILPDLFRQGQGVIAHGVLDPDGLFRADEVLARHDETYMPPEVERAMTLAGTDADDACRSHSEKPAAAGEPATT